MPVVYETRERESLMAPPRAAVPVPGEPSAFGRGLWGRLREAKESVAFFSIFLTVGTAIFLFGLAGTVGPYKEGLRENGDPRFFLAAMGALAAAGRELLDDGSYQFWDSAGRGQEAAGAAFA